MGKKKCLHSYRSCFHVCFANDRGESWKRRRRGVVAQANLQSVLIRGKKKTYVSRTIAEESAHEPRVLADGRRTSAVAATAGDRGEARDRPPD